MNLRRLGAASIFLLSSVLFAADSAKAPQPGQLASADVSPLPESAAPSSSSAVAPATTIAKTEDRHERMMNRLWITSLVAVAAATSVDAGTSWGKLEGNSFLASSNGTFGAKGLGIKMGVAGAVIVPQICFRKHKELRSFLIIGNFGEASIFSAAAAHNLTIRPAYGK
jgi:hypothetical protein